MVAIGVRSSWETLETKRDFIRFSALMWLTSWMATTAFASFIVGFRTGAAVSWRSSPVSASTTSGLASAFAASAFTASRSCSDSLGESTCLSQFRATGLARTSSPSAPARMMPSVVLSRMVSSCAYWDRS